MPHFPGTKVKLPPKAPPRATTRRIGSYSKVTMPAAWDESPTRPGLHGAPVPPLKVPPPQAQRQEGITKPDTPTSQSSRMRAIADQRVDACQTCNRNRLSLWIGIAGAIVTAVGGIAVAVITVWSSHTKTAAELEMDRKLGTKLVEINRQINRVHSRLDDMDKRWRDTRDDLERKIAARPQQRNPDIVTPRARVTDPEVARSPYGL